MNSGKLFEQQFRKSVLKIPNLFYYRLKDSPSSWDNKTKSKKTKSKVRFTNNNICDTVMYKNPYLFLLELKSHTGARLPLSCIRENQINGLVEASETNGIIAGIICDFSDKDKCYFLDITFVDDFTKNETRKSIPISYFQENGIEIDVKKLRVKKLYDVDKFIEQSSIKYQSCL